MAWFKNKQMKTLGKPHIITIQRAAITDLDGEFLKTHGAKETQCHKAGNTDIHVIYGSGNCGDRISKVTYHREGSGGLFQ